MEHKNTFCANGLLKLTCKIVQGHSKIEIHIDLTNYYCKCLQSVFIGCTGLDDGHKSQTAGDHGGLAQMSHSLLTLGVSHSAP